LQAARSNPPAPIIELEDVHLSLGEGAGRVHILKGISLTIERGAAIGLVGPSGSGKSTLLMVMSGLERVDSGTVNVVGHELTNLSEDDLARFRGRHVGIVFQSFHLIANMTALENVAIPLELAGVDNAFEQAEQELRAVGLGERLTHYPGELSGDEQQRVAIARALIAKPDLLIADEPTGNLDEHTGEDIANLLFDLQKERSMTLLLVTHDLKLAGRCNRTIEIRNGEIRTNDDNSPSLLNRTPKPASAAE